MSHDPPTDWTPDDQESDDLDPGLEKQRPDTQVLTRGFGPQLSVGSARPAVFRSSR